MINKNLKLYYQMKLLRMVEEKLVELQPEQNMKTPFHLYIGQEAVAVGVCENLKNSDLVFSNHRSHGHYLAKGGNINNFFCEMYNKNNGCSSGRGGSMHLIDTSCGHMGSSSIMAGSIPISVGAALTMKMKNNKKNTSVSFFGDGAVDEGVLYESLNFSSLHKLNIIFVCENNQLSVNTPIKIRRQKDNLTEISNAFGVQSKRLNGSNVLEIYNEVKKIRKYQKKISGPFLIECDTYRFKDHIGVENSSNYDQIKKYCPIKILEKKLLTENKVSMKKIKMIEKDIDTIIEKANKYGKKSILPNKKDLLKFVYA